MMSLWRLFRCLLRHLTLILALTFLVFRVLDWYNPLMAFSTNPMSSISSSVRQTACTAIHPGSCKVKNAACKIRSAASSKTVGTASENGSRLRMLRTRTRKTST